MLCGEALSSGVCPALRLFSVFAAFLQSPKSFSRLLQHCCKPQKVFRGLCSIPAKSKKFFEAFAAFLQTPKSFSRHLQRFCKPQKVHRGPCRTSANVKMEKTALAELLQASKRRKRPLQHFCKRQKVFRSICSIPASLLVWRKPKEGSGKNDRVLGDKCIGSNGFASAKKRQSVGIDEDGA